MDFERVRRWQAPGADGVMHDVRLVTDLSGRVMWPRILATEAPRDKIVTEGGDYIRVIE